MAKKKKIVLPNSAPPFKEGDRVLHNMFGEGTVSNVHRTGGGLWSTYVEFDEPNKKINGKHAPIASDWLKAAPVPEDG
jgi:hypothetical protein